MPDSRAHIMYFKKWDNTHTLKFKYNFGKIYGMLIAASLSLSNRGGTEKQSLLWLVPSLFLSPALPARWSLPSRPGFSQAAGSLTAMTTSENFPFMLSGLPLKEVMVSVTMILWLP